jgi:hypothetical protein
MKFSSTRVILLTLCLAGPLCAAPFQNLGFEEANTNNVIAFETGGRPDYCGFVDNLLPGWQPSLGTSVVSGIGLDTLPIGGGITLVTPNFSGPNGPPPPVFGSYGLFLLPSYNLLTGDYVGWSLSQRGEVPTDANSIHFMAYGGPLRVARQRCAGGVKV